MSYMGINERNLFGEEEKDLGWEGESSNGSDHVSYTFNVYVTACPPLPS